MFRGHLASPSGSQRVRATPNLDVQRALANARVLITDYSGVTWDMLQLRRPVVFFAPDIDAYQCSRGLHLDLRQDPPGCFADNVEEAITALTCAIDHGLDEAGARWAHNAMAFHDDGNCARVLSAIERRLENRKGKYEFPFRHDMKLLVTTSARIPSRAANSVQTLQMCQAFADNGHAVRLVCRSSDADLSLADFGVSGFSIDALRPRGFRGMRTLAFESTVRRKGHALRPDAVFSRDVFALCALAELGVPLILDMHRTMEGFRAASVAFSYLIGRPNFHRLVVVSRAMEQWFRHHFPRLVHVLVAPGAAARGRNHWCRPLRRDFGSATPDICIRARR